MAINLVSLREILGNKQARGAFGQGRMEAIIQDGLPSNSYTFQATLSNNNRPDCLVKMPNGSPSLAGCAMLTSSAGLTSALIPPAMIP